jgi:hypothetical protein
MKTPIVHLLEETTIDMLEEFGTAIPVKDKAYWKRYFRSIPGIRLNSIDALNPIKQVDLLKVPGVYHIFYMVETYAKVARDHGPVVKVIYHFRLSEVINLEKA